MASGPSFTFTHEFDDVISRLLPTINVGADEAKAITEAVSMMTDRDRDVEDYLTQTLSGLTGSEVTFTAAAGGTIVPFPVTFGRPPVVFLTMVTPGGYTASVKQATTTTTGFTAQVWLGTTEQAAGNFIINWLAMG